MKFQTSSTKESGLGFKVVGFRAIDLSLSGFYELERRNPTVSRAFGILTQTPGRIQKVDPLMGVPIKYP